MPGMYSGQRRCRVLPYFPLDDDTFKMIIGVKALNDRSLIELVIDDNRWVWRNRLLDNETHFVLGEHDSLPLPPLDWVGRQVQEDLLILRGTTEDGMSLVAGHLCFPN